MTYLHTTLVSSFFLHSFTHFFIYILIYVFYTIGIVSPYSAQCRKLKARLKAEFSEIHDGITIGTAESLQGQERTIIIISTVRSNGNLGPFAADERVIVLLNVYIIFIFNKCIYLIFCFLCFFQRLNVMTTRAKRLLIIVGDANTLCLDKNWAELYNHCLKNEATLNNDRKMHPRIMYK